MNSQGSRFARVVPNSRGSIVKITCHPPCGKRCWSKDHDDHEKKNYLRDEKKVCK